MPDDKFSIFRQTELFRGLDDAVLDVLAKYSVVKRLKRNEILFLSGEPAKGLYVVASGAIRAFRTSPEGREQIIHVERAISTVAEVPVFDNGNYPSTTAAEEPTTVYFLDKQLIFKTAVEHPELGLAAIKLLASRLRKCAELVETLSLREVGQRLARLLLEEARNHGTETDLGTRVKLRLTHSQLGRKDRHRPRSSDPHPDPPPGTGAHYPRGKGYSDTRSKGHSDFCRNAKCLK